MYPNGLVSLTFWFGELVSFPVYTKHYYAGSQRVASKLGIDSAEGMYNGAFNCAWLIIPFGGGTPLINQVEASKAILQKATAASLALMQAQGITPPPNYGQNAGYGEECVSSYSGTQEKEMYWFHANHLGSSSFITGIDGEVSQNIEYFPSGEVFVENHINSYNTPYKFNGKELDSETGYYYYGARYYNPRTSIWLNVDPLADYNPFYNEEHYIDGQHNGGVYNSGNNNPYIYTYQNPIVYVDPNGKQVKVSVAFTGGAGTHYSKSDINAFDYRATMLQRNNGFVKVNNIGTGSSFVNSLVSQTKQHGYITGLVTFAHSGAIGIFANNDAGFYAENIQMSGGYSNVDTLASKVRDGSVKFSKNAVWVFGSCFAGNSSDGRLSSPDKTLAEYTASQLNITTVGATGSVYPEVVNSKETGRLSTDGTFMMFTPYQVQVKKQVKETTTLFGIPIWTSTKTVNATETRTKETNLGSTVNPSKLLK